MLRGQPAPMVVAIEAALAAAGGVGWMLSALKGLVEVGALAGLTLGRWSS